MSAQTPRRGVGRPSIGNQFNTSNANFRQSTKTTTTTTPGRNAPLPAVDNGRRAPSTPSEKMVDSDGEIRTGDVVNVPGDMHGIVRFVGVVRGKAGTFAGVELSRDFAHRGKNDGDVDGYLAPEPSLCAAC